MQTPWDIIEASSPTVNHLGVAVAAALLRTSVRIRQKGEQDAHQDRYGDRVELGPKLRFLFSTYIFVLYEEKLGKGFLSR